LPNRWACRRSAIGLVFLLATVALYAGIGIMSRTNDAAEYYVAGRRVPAVYNGMATGADWMSAASFIGMAGTLYLTGYGGLAFIMGWTGGYCLVALFLAPYLRKFGQFTIPDFLGARYEGNLPRFIGILAAILCSFTYVVAQIYGVGLITTRLSGVAFESGIFVGLGGILVCSFLGGMRAVTWTQVAQYIILIVAYMIPVVWLSVKQTGVPIPQAVYGYQLEKVTAREQQLIDDPKEKEVIAIFKKQSDDLAAKLKDVPTALAADKAAATKKVEDLKAASAPVAEVQAAEKALAGLPKTKRRPRTPGPRPRPQPMAAPSRWPACRATPRSTQATPMATPRPEDLRRIAPQLPGAGVLPDGGHGCAAAHPDALLHHAVGEGSARSVTWSLFFIFLLYFTAPALAVLVKYEVFSVLVGTPFDKLPAWISGMDTCGPDAVVGGDVNKDGIFQLARCASAATSSCWRRRKSVACPT
jgi:cation/acetate symporter